MTAVKQSSQVVRLGQIAELAHDLADLRFTLGLSQPLVGYAIALVALWAGEQDAAFVGF